jgi:hypothetical protein
MGIIIARGKYPVKKMRDLFKAFLAEVIGLSIVTWVLGRSIM